MVRGLDSVKVDKVRMMASVRHRLENYHADEAIYYPRLIKMSFIGSYHRQPVQVPGVLIRKIELDKAIDALPATHKGVIKLRYTSEGITLRDALPILCISRRKFYDVIAEGIEMIADHFLAAGSAEGQ